MGFGPTFLPSFTTLSTQGQRIVNRLIADFDPNNLPPGKNLEKLSISASERMYSVRANKDLRVILKKTREAENSWVIVFTGKHDDAYDWAEQKVCEPSAVHNVLNVYTKPVDYAAPLTDKLPLLFAQLLDNQLFALGIPKELVPKVRSIRNLSELHKNRDEFPQDPFEGLVLIAEGNSFKEVLDLLSSPEPPVPGALSNVCFLSENEDLTNMLEKPIAVWRFFLHPSQKYLVTNNWRGPVRVMGAPGTGKTVCAMHRCKHILNTDPNARLLFTTYDEFLARDIEEELKTFISQEHAHRYDVMDLDTLVMKKKLLKNNRQRLVKRESGSYKDKLRDAIQSSVLAGELGLNYIENEFYSVILEQGITSPKSYLKADRRGRLRALTAQQKLELFPVFERYRELVAQNGNIFQEDAYWQLINEIKAAEEAREYTHIIVDEVQDFGRAGLSLIAHLGTRSLGGDSQVFLVGDQNQRISGRKYSFKDCGLNIQGRSRRLRINYRTSSEIFSQSMQILAKTPDPGLEADDSLKSTASLFNGPEPLICAFKNPEQERAALTDWLLKVRGQYPSSEICTVTRDRIALSKIKKLLDHHQLKWHEIRDTRGYAPDAEGIRLTTIARIKGLEFSAVAIVGLNELNSNIEPEVSDLDILERNRIFVAMTRAKKELLISYSGRPSRFLMTPRTVTY